MRLLSTYNYSDTVIKRKGENVYTITKKRQRTAVKEIREADCVYDQAAPYLLVTARFLINALTLA